MVITNIGQVNLANLTATNYMMGVVGTSSSLLTFAPQLTKGFTITPAQLTGTNNNFNPTGLANTNIIELTANTAFPSISGMTAQNNGTIIDLVNTGTNTILLLDEATNGATASTAANRFALNGYDVPLFPKTPIELMYSGTLARWVMRHRLSPIIPNNKYGFYSWREWGQTNTDDLWASTAASGGTNDANLTAAVPQGAYPGVCRMSSGTSATGSGSLKTNNGILFLGNNWYWRYDCIFKFVKLSDGTDTYTLRIGFIDSGTAEPTDGAFFRYTNSVNSGKWVLVNRANSVESSFNATNAALTTTNFYHMTVIVNPAGTQAEFFQDGVSIGTVDANIPTGASRNTGAGLMFLKSAGTSDTGLLDVDAQGLIAYANVAK